MPSAFCANSGAEYHVPVTKRMTGPQLCAAGAPRKCRPSTDDSSPRTSFG